MTANRRRLSFTLSGLFALVFVAGLITSASQAYWRTLQQKRFDAALPGGFGYALRYQGESELRYPDFERSMMFHLLHDLEQIQIVWMIFPDWMEEFTLKIQSIPSLRELDVFESVLTEDAMEQIARHPGLEIIHIEDTKISNSTLMCLTDSKSLRVLRLHDNYDITDADIEAFRRKRPDVRIVDTPWRDVGTRIWSVHTDGY